MKLLKSVLSLSIILSLSVFTSCSEDDDHDHDHNDVEEINKVVLTFTPTGGGGDITATWLDAEGGGAGNPNIEAINLLENTEYEMTITLTNTLGAEEEDITREIEDENHEHQFFFSFTTDIFSNPAGNGNVDNSSDPLNYRDQDDNGLPVGLSTQWTTGSATTSTGEFEVILMHQTDGSKTADSGRGNGTAEVTTKFPININ